MARLRAVGLGLMLIQSKNGVSYADGDELVKAVKRIFGVEMTDSVQITSAAEAYYMAWISFRGTRRASDGSIERFFLDYFEGLIENGELIIK